MTKWRFNNIPTRHYHRFRQFYETLYTSRSSHDDTVMERFLDNYNLPTLNQKDKEYLNADLSIQEIQHTIQILKSGIVAGPDRYSGEFYKEFSDILSPYLLKMYTEANLHFKLPPTLREATIMVIPKKGKDPEVVTDLYRS